MILKAICVQHFCSFGAMLFIVNLLIKPDSTVICVPCMLEHVCYEPFSLTHYAPAPPVSIIKGSLLHSQRRVKSASAHPLPIPRAALRVIPYWFILSRTAYHWLIKQYLYERTRIGLCFNAKYGICCSSKILRTTTRKPANLFC